MDVDMCVDIIFASLCKREAHIRLPDFCERWIMLYLESDFYLLFRMTRSTFKELLRIINFDPRTFTGGEAPVCIEKILLMTLWWLGKGDTFISIADRFNVSISTVHELTNIMLHSINHIMDKYISWPDTVEAAEIERNFREKADFPGILGAIDGCNIHFKCPNAHQASYIDKNQRHSIKLQGVATTNKIFTNISVGFPGSVHDSRVFKNSQIYLNVQEGGYSQYFYEDCDLVGDKAYPLLKCLLTPYKSFGRLTDPQKKYNKYLSKCRIVVEHTFGILKSRWKIVKYINVNSIEKASRIISACCTLHNFCFVHSDFWENYELLRNDNEEEYIANDGMEDEGVIKRLEITEYISR